MEKLIHIPTEGKFILAENLVRLRRSLYYTQEDFSKLLESKRAAYATYEKGIVQPKANTMVLLANLTGYDIMKLKSKPLSDEEINRFRDNFLEKNSPEMMESIREELQRDEKQTNTDVKNGHVNEDTPPYHRIEVPKEEINRLWAIINAQAKLIQSQETLIKQLQKQIKE